jgi:hypothetical protein
VIDLADEFAVAAVAATAADYDELRLAGVAHRFLYGSSCRFGVAEIEVSRSGFYQPAPGGTRAYLVPALPLPAPWDPEFPNDDPGDLVAWLPQQPGRWWCRTGLLPVLNPGAVAAAAHFRERLTVHASPLSWLRAEGGGIVVLSQSVDLKLWLSGVPAVTCETATLGEEINRRLRERSTSLPTILVPRAA